MRQKGDTPMASIQDVAKAAGVSPMTVSRVMRDGTNVRPETRERVLRAAVALNYVPNAVARSLRQARSGLLALIITDMMNPLFYAMARGAEDAAQAAGIAVVLGNSADDAALEAKYLRVMAEHRVDGIILVPTPSTTAADFPSLPERAPLVLLDRRPPDLAAPLVSCDTATATTDLCRHLFALGHRRIAIVGGMPEVPTWRERVAGYRRALREAGRPDEEALVIHGDYRAEGGAAAIRALMALPEPPDAVIAGSAQVLYGVLDELAAQGKSIPDDISVSCLDDPALPTFVRPRFTYVAQPGYEMGSAAVAAVLDGLRTGAPPAADRVFPARLQIGESCREGTTAGIASLAARTVAPAAN